MTRHPDWENRLSEYLASMAGVSFNYGQADCALFAAGAVQAMTGDDPAKAFRGKYKSMAGSVRALKDIGAGTLEATISAMFSEIPPAFARRGDLVMHDGAVGVCVGSDALFILDASQGAGLERITRERWQKAFRT